MALKRIVGSAVRHPLASTAVVVGVAKGTVTVVRRLVGGQDPLAPTHPDTSQESPTSPEAAVATETVKEPEVVPLEPEDRDLPEPVVIYAEDDEPEPAPEVDLDQEDELVWTSESTAPPPSE